MRLKEFETDFLKRKNATMLERYQKGIVLTPVKDALYRKLKSLQEEGIGIDIVGLEAFDLTDINDKP
jgi:hypothetical protein